MVKKYRKGYMGERELVHTLNKKGYAVQRAPRSGSMGIPCPDVIAVKEGEVFAFECKSRKSSFSVRDDQLEQLEEWEKRSHGRSFIAWKYPYKGWFFIPLSKVKNNNGNVNTSMLEGAILLDYF